MLSRNIVLKWFAALDNLQGYKGENMEIEKLKCAQCGKEIEQNKEF